MKTSLAAPSRPPFPFDYIARGILPLVALTALVALPGHCATLIWTSGSGTDTNWSTGANWTNATAGTAGTAPASGDDTKFFDAGAVVPVSTINNLVDGLFGGTIASLQYGNTNGAHTTLILPGQTLSITGTGGLLVGTPGDVGIAKNLTNTITGAGATLNLNNSSANLTLNQGSATTGVTGTRANLDLSGLDNFIMNGRRLGLGTTVLPNPNNANQREAGCLLLAKTNIITLGYSDTLANYQLSGKTNALEMSRNPGNNAGIPSLLVLGQSNYFGLDSLGMGRDKASGNSAAWVGFNPALTNNNPVAVFRNSDGVSRVTWWALGDMNAVASSSQVSVGTNDFTGGTVDALVNVMSVTRDCVASHTAGTAIIGVLTFSAGTVDVNTLYVGNQAIGPSTSSTPLRGIVNVNGGTLVVNSNLVLGNTTVANSVAATNTSGTLSIRNGTVRANSISTGTQSTNNVITMTNGLLVVSNTIGTPAKGLTTLTMTNSTLQLNTAGPSNIVVTNFITGGATNVLNPASVVIFPSYPTQITLVKYFGAAIGGVGYNIGFGASILPPTAPNAYLSNNVANHSIDLVLPCDPRPVITSQPSSFSGDIGTNVTFTAVVGSCSVLPLTYQWYLGSIPLADGPTGNGSTLSGATTASLTITSAQTNDNGNYSVVINNLYGSATSAPPANLTISAGCVPPSISGGPNNTTVVQGNNATFTAIVAGSPVPALQWQRAGVDIPGATANSYTVMSAQYPADDGMTFSIVATNACGAATNSATLTVIVPPSFSCLPTNLTVLSGAPASFTICALAVPAPTYQWLKNGAPIAGATDSTLSFAATVPSNAAVYSVVVNNSAGTTNSPGATLLVNSTMAVGSLSPANGASGICPDTILRLTFDSAPILGNAGKISIFNITNSATPVDTIDLAGNTGVGTQPRTIAGSNYQTYPVVISGNTATIFPHLGVLTTNQTYYVLVEDVLGGCFKDSTGATFAGINGTNVWQFTTKPGGPANPTNLVVAADGSGDFCTVQGAVDFVPSGNTTPRTIKVRNGFYQEVVFINIKNNLTFIGDNRDLTQISYANNDSLNGGTALRPAFRAQGNDNTFVNLTLTNSTPKGGTQAEALRTDGKRITLLGVKLASFQDTMLNNNKGDLVYIQDSLIQGDTDFIWGLGTTFITNCEIRTLSSGTQITQARTTAGTNGFSFVNCQITRAGGAVTNCGFGRDLGFTDNNVAFINCTVGDHITGWLNADARDWEFGLTNSSGVLTQYNGVQLTSGDPRLVLASSATNWLYGWVPQVAPIILTNPASLSVAGGATATFVVFAVGVENPTYQWLKDGTPLPGASSATLIINSAHAGDAAAYSVVVSNSAGSITSSGATLTVANTAPTLDPIANQTVNVGVTVNFAAAASDPDVPPQALSFSMPVGPTNATLDVSTGAFNWRPLVSQGGTVNPVTIVAADNGSPSLSATQSFTITVNALTRPTVGATGISAGLFSLSVTGQTGPDYAVRASTNLFDWQTVFVTNSPATPFQWTDPATGLFPLRFYQIVVGPPLP
jgi:hypothetical protein